MICGGEGDMCEPGKQPIDKDFTEWWVYCKKCDCWTEHPISVLDSKT